MYLPHTVPMSWLAEVACCISDVHSPAVPALLLGQDCLLPPQQGLPNNDEGLMTSAGQDSAMPIKDSCRVPYAS